MPKLSGKKKFFTPADLLAVFFILLVVLYFFQQQTQHIEAAGTNYYVDSTSGSDSNSGTLENQPWKTLVPVQSHTFQPGDTVYFKRGSSWTGGLIIDDSGAEGNPITFKAYGSGGRPVLRNSGQWNKVITIEADWVVVEDLLVQEAHEAGIYLKDGADHNLIRNIEATNVGQGILVYGQNNLLIENYLHDLKMVVNDTSPDNDYGAVGVSLVSSNNEVSYNRIINCLAPSYDYGVDGGAFEWFGYADNNYVHHNWASGNDGVIEAGGGSAKNNVVAYNVFVNNRGIGGFHLAGGYGSLVENFRFENNVVVEAGNNLMATMIGWWSGGSPSANTFIMRNNIVYVKDKAITNQPGFSHDHNLYYRLDGGTNLGFTLGEGEQIADPLFINLTGEDFHLQPESPAIDAGVDLGYPLDFDNQSVPIGPAPDLGAYEYPDGVPPTATVTPSPSPTSPLTPTPTPTPPNPYDLSGDGQVNAADVLLLLQNWINDSQGDFNSDGQVNSLDFGLLIAHWGN